MTPNLKKWIKSNNLSVIRISPEIFSIEDVGEILFLEEKDGLIVDADMHLILSKKEKSLLEDEDIGIKYVLFEFGDRFYYAEFDLDKYYDTETLRAKFNDFKFLGKRKKDLDEEFCNLGVHSEYELMNGSRLAEDWVKKAKFLGHKSLGIIDKNTLGGILAFQIACDKAKIKPILGETINVAYSMVGDKPETNELVVYVKNEEGWRNLLLINKYINIDNDGFIWEKELKNCCGGLIAVLSKESVVNKINDLKIAKNYIKTYSEWFDDLYYQIDSVDYFDEYKYKEYASSIYKYLHDFSSLVKPVLIGDSYYLDEEEAIARIYLNETKKVRQALSHKQHYKNLYEHINSLYEVYDIDDSKEYVSGKTFGEILQDAISNTIKISNDCDFKIDVGRHKLPKFECQGDRVELFFNLLQKGLKKKIIKTNKDIDKYLSRLEEEADLIVNSEFVDYFLILWDIVKWAKDNDIGVGTGRGSVGGSLVAYLLDITDIDPIQFDLLFERFLNKTRLSGERAQSSDALPDVDLDFSTDGKDLVKKYMTEKYGSNYVCSVGTYNRARLKGVIKDFARCDGMPFSYVNMVTKCIEHRLDDEWDDIFSDAMKNNILREFISKNPVMINAMKSVLNQAKVPSVHASAVIIVPKQDYDGNDIDIFQWIPVRKVVDELGQTVLVSEWEGKYLERAGFLKEDILGLSQLDKFKFIINLIKKLRGENIDLSRIPLDDKNAFDIFSGGFNEDVFQMGSYGLKRYCKTVLPDSIEDIIAINALWRPGPMGSNAHTDYADIKHGNKKPEFDYGLREVTSKTYGLYIYQEQIMKATHVLGKLTLSEADEVRTVMKKFDKEKMATFRDKFINGAIENGCKRDKAEQIWIKLEKFSGYGFNRSHSAAYGIMAYYCAWFKAYYPEEFYTSSLNFSKSEMEVISILDEIESRKLRLKIYPPDINKSNIYFNTSIEESSIYWSLVKIKGLANKTVTKILDERKKCKFKSLSDFLSRMKGTGVGKGVAKDLITSGAFDSIENISEPRERRQLIKSLCTTNKEVEQFEKDYPKEVFYKNYMWTYEQKALTGFGKVDYRGLLKNIDKKLSALYLKPDEFLEIDAKNIKTCLAGRIVGWTERDSKRGKFGVLALECNDKMLNAILWSDVWKEQKSHVEKTKKNNGLVVVTGRTAYDNWRNCNVLYSEEGFTKIIDL